MKITTGAVGRGKDKFEADLQQETLGSIPAAGDSGFWLTMEQEQELVTALHDIRSGNYEDGHELLRELKELTRR
jgi:hypothetical protein